MLKFHSFLAYKILKDFFYTKQIRLHSIVLKFPDFEKITFIDKFFQRLSEFIILKMCRLPKYKNHYLLIFLWFTSHHHKWIFRNIFLFVR